MNEMNDEYILSMGYHQYNPTPYDNNHIIARFQKRFDDDIGKKYFIDVIKWSNEFIPIYGRSKDWEPFTYEYHAQVTMLEDEKALNFEFFSSWTLNDVEKFMEDFFEKMKPNYYEKWEY